MCIKIKTPREVTDEVIVAYKVFVSRDSKLHGIYYGPQGKASERGATFASGNYKKDKWYVTDQPGFQSFAEKEDARYWAKGHGVQGVGFHTVIVAVQIRKVLGTGDVGSVYGYGNSNSAYAALEMRIPKGAEKEKVLIERW